MECVIICSIYRVYTGMLKSVSFYFDMWRKIVCGIFYWCYSATNMMKLIWIVEVHSSNLFVEYGGKAFFTHLQRHTKEFVYVLVFGEKLFVFIYVALFHISNVVKLVYITEVFNIILTVE